MSDRPYRITARQHVTWDQFHAIVKQRPNRSPHEVWGNSSIDRSTFRRKFTLTRSLPHALQVAAQGWPEGRERMLQGIEHDTEGNVPSLFPAREYDVAGEWPDVAAYCAGVPEHMVSQGEASLTGAPVVRIGINGVYPASTSSESIHNFGIALLSHVAAYQRAGYSVALDWHSLAASDGKVCWTRVEILSAGGTIDLDRLAFMLAHPAMVRRMWFGFIEQYPEASFIQQGYGHNVPHHKIEGWEYDGVMLPPLIEVPTYTVETAAEAIGRVIEGEPAAQAA